MRVLTNPAAKTAAIVANSHRKPAQEIDGGTPWCASANILSNCVHCGDIRISSVKYAARSSIIDPVR